MGRIAQRYFAGLFHAEVIVLHKHGVAPGDVTNTSDCSDAFIRSDSLSTWRGDLIESLEAAQATAFSDNLPQWLVGISEGGEIAPYVAEHIRNLQGVVLIGSAGLDPPVVAEMRLNSHSSRERWADLMNQAASSLPEDTIVEGRSLTYWRDFLSWRTETLLHTSSWPLLQAWGTDDEDVPGAAYVAFSQKQDGRPSPYCALEIDGANHNLQTPDRRDGIQQVWSILEAWMREGATPCAPKALRADAE